MEWNLGLLAQAVFSVSLLTAASAQSSPEQARAALEAGNDRFAQDKCIVQRTDDRVRRTLAEGQKPFAIVLCCSDSRVPPEHVFDVGLGELFVVRVAGNVCDPELLASVEYAAEHLGAQFCVVLGHESCGAVKATATMDPAAVAHASPAIQGLLQRIEPSVQRARAMTTAPEGMLACAEAENAQQTIVEAMRRSAILRELAAKGRFKMVAARYQMRSGVVEWLPERPLDLAATADKDAEPHQLNSPPQAALVRLQEGHRRFRLGAPSTAAVSEARRQELVAGQKPRAIVVTCSDSRVAPEHIFDCGLGEIFVVRVAGNVLNDDVQASIEYAAEHTGAPLVVVMGHSNCGAVKAAAAASEPAPRGHESHDPGPNLSALIAKIAPSVAEARKDRLAGHALVERAIERNVLTFQAALRAKSEVVAHLEHDGQLTVLGAVYQLDSGDIRWLADPEQSPAAPGGEPGAHGGTPAVAPGGAARPSDERGAASGTGKASPSPSSRRSYGAAGAPTVTPAPGVSGGTPRH